MSHVDDDVRAAFERAAFVVGAAQEQQRAEIMRAALELLTTAHHGGDITASWDAGVGRIIDDLPDAAAGQVLGTYVSALQRLALDFLRALPPRRAELLLQRLARELEQ